MDGLRTTARYSRCRSGEQDLILPFPSFTQGTAGIAERQMASDRSLLIDYRPKVSQLRLGLSLGVVFGLWNLIATRLDPLAEDTLVALLVFYGPMFAVWGVVGFRASRCGGHLVDAVTAGGTVAFITFMVFVAARLITLNLSLDITSQRLDWQNLVLRYQASGFQSLRAYANYEYITGAPLKILVATTIGAGMGFVGGLCGRRNGSGSTAPRSDG
jgi:hypothetical protein